MPSATTSARVSAISPSTPVAQLARVGPGRAQRLERLGIVTVRDLLYHLPRRYEDTRAVTPVAELRAGEVQTARVVIRNVSMRRSNKKPPMVLVEASLVEGHDVVGAVWFNQPFLHGKLHRGMELLVSGKVQSSRGGLAFRNPAFEPVGDAQRHVGRLAPVYPETDKLTSRMLRGWIEPLLYLADALPDRLPPSVRAAENRVPLGTALHQVHFPDDEDSRARASERIAFEELFLLQLAAGRARRRRLSSGGVAIPYDIAVARAFVAALPFRLTNGQRIAAHEILTDMSGSGPMNRLLQGDVGSGKTAVAAMAALMARAGGSQTAVMAPTEVL